MSQTSTVGVPAIELKQVHKTYGSGDGQMVALDGVSLSIKQGEFLCLVGASGCGKSTLLNMLVGLDQPSAGVVQVQGRSTLMFQESALFPWLTVGSNIGLALKLRGIPRRERAAKANELLRMVQLEGLANKRPHELSGGMRQRVAIARAFAQDVDVLCMDEPFGALDAMTRDLLHDELERLWIERNLTVVFVTHNVREAVRLADRVVLLSSRPGKVLDTFEVDIDRPRRMDSPQVSSLAATITDRLRQEVRRHVND
ncbi:MAG: ABC transporter ATP-binding protein [Microthrixaceae bacterium]